MGVRPRTGDRADGLRAGTCTERGGARTPWPGEPGAHAVRAVHRPAGRGARRPTPAWSDLERGFWRGGARHVPLVGLVSLCRGLPDRAAQGSVAACSVTTVPALGRTSAHVRTGSPTR